MDVHAPGIVAAGKGEAMTRFFIEAIRDAKARQEFAAMAREPQPPPVTYRREKYKNARGIYWCNVHQRPATYSQSSDGRRCCNPNLGGILVPCDVVFAPMRIERRKVRP